MELAKATEVMKEVLGLSYEPIAVKLLESTVTLDGREEGVQCWKSEKLPFPLTKET